MKVTKYPQSCLLIEEGGTRILIDPGSFATEKYKLSDFGKLDAVLYTHQHGDHLDQSWLEAILAANIKIISNQAVANVIGTDKVEVINDRESTKINDLTIQAHDLPHFAFDDSQMPQNTGYLIGGTLFDPGDSAQKPTVDATNVALTIGGPDDNFFSQADELAQHVGAKKVIPIHYDGHYKPDPNTFATDFGGKDYEVIVLKDGESTEL